MIIDLSKPKIGCLSSITNTFEFVQCSKNDVRVRSMFDEMVFDPSLELNHALSIAPPREQTSKKTLGLPA